MTCFVYPPIVREFDEQKFLSDCMQGFSEIRNKYQLNEDTLKSAQNNPMLKKMAL